VGKEPVHFIDGLEQAVADGERAWQEIRGDVAVAGEAADTGIADGKTGAGEQLVEVVNILALTDQIEQGGEGSKVHGVSADADGMIHDAAEFGEDDAEILRPLAHLDAEKFLDRQDIGEVVVEGRDVIHPVGDGDDLIVGAVLAELFKTVVEVADFRDAVDDALAVEFEHQPQGAVRGGMGGPEVEKEPLLLGLVDELVEIGLLVQVLVIGIHALPGGCQSAPLYFVLGFSILVKFSR